MSSAVDTSTTRLEMATSFLNSTEERRQNTSYAAYVYEETTRLVVETLRVSKTLRDVYETKPELKKMLGDAMLMWQCLTNKDPEQAQLRCLFAVQKIYSLMFDNFCLHPLIMNYPIERSLESPLVSSFAEDLVDDTKYSLVTSMFICIMGIMLRNAGVSEELRACARVLIPRLSLSPAQIPTLHMRLELVQSCEAVSEHGHYESVEYQESMSEAGTKAETETTNIPLGTVPRGADATNAGYYSEINIGADFFNPPPTQAAPEPCSYALQDNDCWPDMRARRFVRFSSHIPAAHASPPLPPSVCVSAACEHTRSTTATQPQIYRKKKSRKPK